MTDILRQRKDKAAEFFAKGELRAALSEYQSVLEEEPEDVTSRQKVAELFQKLGYKKEAITTYEVLAEVWGKKGQVLRAIALCKILLQIEPGHVGAKRLLATFHSRQEPEPSSQPEPPPKPVTAGPAAEPISPPAAGASSAGKRARIPIFSQLSGEELLSMVEHLELKVFQRGEVIIQEGQSSGFMFAIVEGSVEVVQQLETGGERTVALMSEGDLFGEMALVSDGPRRSTARAYERTLALELTRAEVEQLIHKHPSVGQVLQTFKRERLLSNMLRTNPLFQAMPQAQREALAADFQLCSMPVGKTLTVQGQQVEALYLLLEGQCLVRREHTDGREPSTKALHAGDVFGEISLLLRIPATANVETVTRCTLLRLDRLVFEQHIFSQPGLWEMLSRICSERLQQNARMDAGMDVQQ
jgi:cAMP-dependent protein kinase regulator